MRSTSAKVEKPSFYYTPHPCYRRRCLLLFKRVNLPNIHFEQAFQPVFPNFTRKVVLSQEIGNTFPKLLVGRLSKNPVQLHTASLLAYKYRCSGLEVIICFYLRIGCIISLIAVRKNLEECLKDYSIIEERNARNSLPNEYPKSAFIMRSESRDETDADQNTRHQAQESDENGNLERRSSTEESSNKELRLTVEKQPSLQTGKDDLPQAFLSSVHIKENEQIRGYSGDEKPRRRSGVDQILALRGNNEKTMEETSQEIDGSHKLKRSEEVSAVHDSDTSQDQTFGKRVDDFRDVTAITKDDSAAMSGENLTVQDDTTKITSPDGSVPTEQIPNDVNYASSGTHSVAVTENWNKEHTSIETKDTSDEGEHHQQEESENAANGTEQSQTMIKASTGLDPEKMESSHADIASENGDRKVATENDKNEQFDQLRETTLEGN